MVLRTFKYFFFKKLKTFLKIFLFSFSSFFIFHNFVSFSLLGPVTERSRNLVLNQTLISLLIKPFLYVLRA